MELLVEAVAHLGQVVVSLGVLLGAGGLRLSAQQLKSLDQEEEEKGLFGFFKKASNRVENMKVQYSKAEVNVDKIVRELEQHQRVLMKDIAMFDQMYELNLKYYKELTMYIIAGKKRLAEIQSGQLEELRRKAEGWWRW